MVGEKVAEESVSTGDNYFSHRDIPYFVRGKLVDIF